MTLFPRSLAMSLNRCYTVYDINNKILVFIVQYVKKSVCKKKQMPFSGTSFLWRCPILGMHLWDDKVCFLRLVSFLFHRKMWCRHLWDFNMLAWYNFTDHYCLIHFVFILKPKKLLKYSSLILNISRYQLEKSIHNCFFFVIEG